MSQSPVVHVAPAWDKTYGDIASKFAADYGLVPDVWQEMVLDDWLAETNGQWSGLTCGISVPRQNGKNVLLEVRELFGLVGRGERILHTAHEVKTAAKHFKRFKHFFGEKRNDPGAKFPALNALVEQVRNANGQEGIYLKNGGQIEFIARSKNSGRGFTVDVLVMDEAQEMSEDALEALMPTTSAAPTGNPQWIYTGTPPGPEAQGDVFARVRAEALAGKSKRLVWHEWSPPEKFRLDDRELWRRNNPGVDTNRLQMAVIEGERARFSDDGFARERLGQWPALVKGKPRIKTESWRVLVSDTVPEGRRVAGVKFSPDGLYAALAVATRPNDDDDPIHVDGLRVASTSEGVGWIADWLKQRETTVSQVIVDGKGWAPVLVDQLDKLGLPVKRDTGRDSSRYARLVSVPQIIEAHSMFLDAVQDENLTHGGDETLDLQVAEATTRKIGTAGGWGWLSLTETGTTVLLDAATFAYWGAKTVTRDSEAKQRTVMLA